MRGKEPKCSTEIQMQKTLEGKHLSYLFADSTPITSNHLLHKHFPEVSISGVEINLERQEAILTILIAGLHILIARPALQKPMCVLVIVSKRTRSFVRPVSFNCSSKTKWLSYSMLCTITGRACNIILFSGKAISPPTAMRITAKFRGNREA